MSTEADHLKDMEDKASAEELAAEEAAKKAAEEAAAKAAADEAAAKAAADAEAAKKASEEAAAKAAADAAAKGKSEVDDSALRATAREQKRELDRQALELERMRRQLEKAGIGPDEEDKKKAEAEEAEAKKAIELRETQLNTILETMKLNPQFSDIESVVSQDNFDDLVEALGRVYVERNGGTFREACRVVEQQIWALPNPYAYAYDKIKQFHPSFVKAAVDAAKKAADEAAAKKAAEDAAKKAEEEAKKKGEPPAVPSSVAGLPGGASGPGGWTAAMIDELEEEELPTVPADTYQKYLRGELK